MASPTLPQLTMSTTDPLASCIRTVDCSATADATLAGRLTLFTNAITNARFGDLIVTEPGDTLDGNWVLPKQTLGTAGLYTVIRPKSFDSAVAIGTRATSSTGMTTLRSVASSGGAGHCDSVITVPSTGGTAYWWISGLEVVPKASTFCDGALVLFSPSNNAENPANQTDHMMVDRCYIHGDSPSGTNGGPGTLRALQFAGTYQGCIHSTLDEIKVTDAQGEAQCITMAFGAGPVHIENNTLGCTTQSVLFETPTGETISSVTVTTGTTVTRASGSWNYDVVGKTFNCTGDAGATVSTRNSDTVITLSTSVTNRTGVVGYVNYARSGNPGFFPGDITIKRNYFRKKNAWNIAHATFERISGSDTNVNNMTIHASDNTKIAAGSAPGLTDGRQIYVTGGTGWTTGYAYVVSIDGSSNYQMNRAMGTVGSTGGTAKLKYSVKNALEFKSGSRVLVQGNVFDGSWCGGQNFILTFTPRYTNSPAGDLTFKDNIVKNAYAIAVITASESSGGGGTPGPYLQNHRISMTNNLFENMQCVSGSPYWALGASENLLHWFLYATTDTVNGVVGGATTMDDFVFEHNTIAGSSTRIGGNVWNHANGASGFTKGKRFIFRNNVICTDTAASVINGTSANDSTAMDQVTVNASSADDRTVTKNVYFNTALTGGGLTGVDAGNAFVTSANIANLSFSNYAGGDYTITGGTYDLWGSDSTDPGYNKSTLDRMTSGAVTGVWPAQFYLPIRWP